MRELPGARGKSKLGGFGWERRTEMVMRCGPGSKSVKQAKKKEKTHVVQSMQQPEFPMDSPEAKSKSHFERLSVKRMEELLCPQITVQDRQREAASTQAQRTQVRGTFRF